MKIAQEVINEIREKVDIVDVVSEYVPLVPKGRNFMGVCPFHDDNNPSMSVSREKKIFKCFSCGATGTVFKFVMDYENISFPEAIAKLAPKAGIHLDIDASHKPKVRSPLYDVYALSLKFYTNNLHTAYGKKAKSYLQKRGFTEEMINKYQVGLALNDRNTLSKILTQKYDENTLMKSGLIGQNEKHFYDLFYDRIMFPLYDLDGKVIAYSGRIYDREDNSKYFNTRETEIFKKGELLYNYHRAKPVARKSGQVIVMEGFMDVIKASTIGLENVVATMGTGVTPFQANLIKKMAKEIILCFDGDDAGRKATISLGDELLKIGVSPKVVALDGYDPDEYITKFGEEFLTKIKNPINIIDFKFNYFKLGLNLQSSDDLAKYTSTMLDEIDKLGTSDDILKEVALKRLSEESGLEVNLLKEKVAFTKEKPKPVKIRETVKYDKYLLAQRNLIYYMLKSEQVIKMYDAKITYMPEEKYRLLAREISLFYHNFGYIDEAEFMDYVIENEELTTVLNEISLADLKDDYSTEEIEDYINVIYEYNVKNEVIRLKNKMAGATDALAKAQIAQKIVELKKGVENNV